MSSQEDEDKTPKSVRIVPAQALREISAQVIQLQKAVGSLSVTLTGAAGALQRLAHIVAVSALVTVSTFILLTIVLTYKAREESAANEGQRRREAIENGKLREEVWSAIKILVRHECGKQREVSAGTNFTDNESSQQER